MRHLGSTQAYEPIARTELPTDTVELARYLIGAVVVRELEEGFLSGRIVETEAYVVGDAAGHGFRGVTKRNRSLFLERGFAYIYIAYGLSAMLNVSSEGAGTGTGVLIRALEPGDGVSLMQRHRGLNHVRELTRGPGKLTAALKIDLGFDGLDLCVKGPLWLAHGLKESLDIGQSVRIGISKDAERPLRFFLRGSPFLSGPASLNR